MSVIEEAEREHEADAARIRAQADAAERAGKHDVAQALREAAALIGLPREHRRDGRLSAAGADRDQDGQCGERASSLRIRFAGRQRGSADRAASD